MFESIFTATTDNTISIGTSMLGIGTAGVHSPFMTYFFAVPLIFGCLPNCIAVILERKIRTWHIASDIYCAGIAAVTVSCVLRGIFEIAGTSSVYQALLMWFGIAMSVVGAVSHGIFMIKNA